MSVLIELFYFEYMVGRGMLDKTVALPFGGWLAPFSTALALALGNALFLASIWQSLFSRTVYAGLSSDRRVRRIIFPLRVVRTAAVVLAPFTILLFLPYILESTWYVGMAAGLANSTPALKGSIQGFYSWSYGLSRLDAPSKFVVSQVIAAFGTLVVAGLLFWRARGTRAFTGLVRRRRLK